MGEGEKERARERENGVGEKEQAEERFVKIKFSTIRSSKTYFTQRAECQHRVKFEECNEPPHELVIGNHLHQLLPLTLTLCLQHAGSCLRVGQVDLHVIHEVGSSDVVVAQARENTFKHGSQIRTVHVDGIIAGPPGNRFVL